MTTEEFSIEFDLLYNNISSNKSPGFNEFEKSEFLTQAQESLVLELYSGNPVGRDSFESSEDISNYLSRIVKSKTFEGSDITQVAESENIFSIPAYRINVNEDNDLWFIIYETCFINSYSGDCSIKNPVRATVLPVKHDDVYNIIENPFRGANKKRVLRLYKGGEITTTINDPESEGDTIDVVNSISEIELISKFTPLKYSIRYIRRPKPIILTDLTSTGLSINGAHIKTECELPDSLHRTILLRAVELAKTVWAS